MLRPSPPARDRLQPTQQRLHPLRLFGGDRGRRMGQRRRSRRRTGRWGRWRGLCGGGGSHGQAGFKLLDARSDLVRVRGLALQVEPEGGDGVLHLPLVEVGLGDVVEHGGVRLDRVGRLQLGDALFVPVIRDGRHTAVEVAAGILPRVRLRLEAAQACQERTDHGQDPPGPGRERRWVTPERCPPTGRGHPCIPRGVRSSFPSVAKCGIPRLRIAEG